MTEHTAHEPERNKRLHAIVYGDVQGVGFRYATESVAERLGLVGYVRNRWDGTVEVVAEGPQSVLDRLLAWLHRGPGAAHVTQVKANWYEPEGEFDEFRVRL